MMATALEVGAKFAKLFYSIYSALDGLHDENGTANRICERADDIRSLLEEYNEHCDPGVAEQMKKIIDDNYKKLERYVMECNNIKKEGNFKRFQHAWTGSNSKMLQELSVLLDRIYQNINSHALHALSTQVHGRFSSSVPRKSGVHSVRSDSGALEVPSKVDRPEVYMKGPQLHVKVNDRINNRKDLDEYHVSINKQWHTLKKDNGSLYDTAIIEPEGMNPPLQPGKLYSFQVRAKNAKGLGEWSDSTDMRLDTGILSKPDKPSIDSDPGTGVVKVKVRIPKTYVNHVTQVVCQHHDKENGREWISENFQIPENSNAEVRTFSLTKCSPYAHHHLRIIFINKFGESEPSDTVDIAPAIPGEPTEVRQSSNCTSSMIKLCWEPPELGKEFVDHYLIRYKRGKDMDKDDIRFLTIKVKKKVGKNKFSAKAKNLSSATNYIFSISAVNAHGASGQPVDIVADTRWKKAAKAALSSLVFFGETVDALYVDRVAEPIVEAGVSRGVDSYGGAARIVGAVVIGGIAGTVAAVIVPIMGKVAMHMFVHGGSISDQSDEDDN